MSFFSSIKCAEAKDLLPPIISEDIENVASREDISLSLKLILYKVMKSTSNSKIDMSLDAVIFPGDFLNIKDTSLS